MSYTRQLDAFGDEGGVLMGCSICGFACVWPHEVKRSRDGLFRCFRHTETETPLEHYEKRARTPLKDESAPAHPVGPKPGWYP
jgi:hypothetical protein